MYRQIAKLWKSPDKNMGQIQKLRLAEWRKQQVVTRIKRPTRLDRARSLGYRAKQGIALARVRVKKGLRKRPKPSGGRGPSKAGRFFSLGKSKQVVAEEKAARKFRNLEVVASYPVGQDGIQAWFEIILLDRVHPAVKSDRVLSRLASQRGRAFRGKTPSSR